MTQEVSMFLSSGASSIVAIVVCLINNHFQNSKTLALIDLRLGNLEEKVDKHNNVVDRTYKLEGRADVFDEKLEALKKAVGK